MSRQQEDSMSCEWPLLRKVKCVCIACVVFLCAAVLVVGQDANKLASTEKALPSSDIKDLAREGNPPFINAAMDGNLSEITKLLNAGVHPDTTNRHGQTALMWASTYGASNVVDVLIQKGGKVDRRDAVHQATALIYAVRGGHAVVVRRLLDFGANINARDSNGQTPAIHAVVANKFRILEVLISRNADLNIQDRQGMTALMWAAMLQSPDSVKLLISAGADVTLRTPAGMQAEDFAVDDLRAVLTGKGGRHEQ